jgi:hypothetical protein
MSRMAVLLVRQNQTIRLRGIKNSTSVRLQGDELLGQPSSSRTTAKVFHKLDWHDKFDPR